MKLFKSKKGILLILPILLSLLGFSLCFVSGIYQPSTFIEQKANSIANIVLTETTHKQYLPLIVQPKTDSKSKMIDPGTEFHDLYGSFKENIASYASMLNADHQHKAYFDSEFYKDYDTNISFLYVRYGFNFSQYKGNIFKHEKYPIETMFGRNVKGTTPRHLICISLTQANKLLDNKGLEHTSSNYEKLIGEDINISIDGSPVEWKIANIYFEDNYYFEAIKNNIGDFVFVTAGEDEIMKNQSVYFLSSYAFRNKHYLNYALSLYSQEHFNYSFGNADLIDGYSIDPELCNFSSSGQNGIIGNMFFSFSIICLVSSVVCLFFVEKLTFGYCALYVFSAFLPYFVFKFIYLVRNDLVFFSSFSTTCNWIMLLSVLVISIVIFLWRKYRLNAKNHRKN